MPRFVAIWARIDSRLVSIFRCARAVAPHVLALAVKTSMVAGLLSFCANHDLALCTGRVPGDEMATPTWDIGTRNSEPFRSCPSLSRLI